MNKFYEHPALRAIQMLDNSPAMKAIRTIENQPYMKIMREFQKSPLLNTVRQFENSPSMKVIRQFEESPAIKIMRELGDSPTLKILQDFKDSPAFKSLQKIQESPALRVLSALETSPVIVAFSRVTEQLNNNYGELLFTEAYELISRECETILDDESLDSISKDVQNRAEQASKSALSAEFYINLFLALFLYYLANMSAQESEHKVLERLNEIEETITTQLQEIEKVEECNFLVADRTMNLREGAGIEHLVIGEIVRNKKLLEIKRDRDWVKVEFFDYIKNVSVIGWAHSKSLISFTLSCDESKDHLKEYDEKEAIESKK